MQLIFNGQKQMIELHSQKENFNGAKAYARKQSINARDRQILIRDYIQRCHEEVHEMAEELVLGRMPEAHEEMIDTLSFVTSLCILCGVEEIDPKFLEQIRPELDSDEFLSEFNWGLFAISRQLTAKPWKTKRPKVDEKTLSEKVQYLWCLTFLWCSAYIPDVVTAYQSKMAKVMERHSSGY